MRSIIFITFLLTAISQIANAESPWTPQQPEFETLAGPIQLQASHDSIALTGVRASFEAYEPRIVRAASFGRKALDVSRLGKESGALACINGSFFDEQQEPLGLVISGGTTSHGIQFGGTLLTGVFYATRTNVGIAPRNALNPAPVLEALQGGPRLMSDSKVLQGIRDQEMTKRSAVCIDPMKKISLVTVATPITLIQLQEILVDPNFNCTDALNLDGGSSSDIYFSPRLPTPPEPVLGSGAAQVPVALCLFAKKKM